MTRPTHGKIIAVTLTGAGVVVVGSTQRAYFPTNVKYTISMGGENVNGGLTFTDVIPNQTRHNVPIFPAGVGTNARAYWYADTVEFEVTEVAAFEVCP